LDVEDVLKAKAVLLADLVRKARKLTIYAGAGLSTASGVGDYATRTGSDSVLGREAEHGGHGQPSFILPERAKPNVGHFVLSAMTQAGLVWRIVQQNHDGLLQKAGVPQRYVNEIHGSWFDPGNPVVKMTENVRDDLYEDTCTVEREADLVIVRGSSLAGMNTDRIVRSCATRSMSQSPSVDCLGSVIVSLQRTPHDAESSLRVFSTISSFMMLLAAELDLQLPEDCCSPVVLAGGSRENTEVDVFSVPYNRHGTSIPAAMGASRMLDLREGSELMVVIGADKGQPAVVVGKKSEGHYKMRVKRANIHGGVSSIRYLGLWWIKAAISGDVSSIPVVTP
jgi:NAD-dependent SIR2 family protein deacetylase